MQTSAMNRNNLWGVGNVSGSLSQDTAKGVAAGVLGILSYSAGDLQWVYFVGGRVRQEQPLLCRRQVSGREATWPGLQPKGRDKKAYGLTRLPGRMSSCLTPE